MREKITFLNVGSGSKGNASFLMYKNTLIQIDMGLTLSRVKDSLAKLNKSILDIDGILITHNHGDHIKGLNLYHDEIPIYASKGSLDNQNVKLINAFEKLKIKDIDIKVLKTSHDAPNPLGFLFLIDDIKICYLTDSGVIPAQTLKLINNCNCYIFESNHDVDMLENSNRPVWLIKRILSKKGHLSNQQSATYLESLIGENTTNILLAHLSEDCNIEAKAIDVHKTQYINSFKDTNKINILALRQDKETVLCI